MNIKMSWYLFYFMFIKLNQLISIVRPKEVFDKAKKKFVHRYTINIPCGITCPTKLTRIFIVGLRPTVPTRLIDKTF